MTPFLRGRDLPSGSPGSQVEDAPPTVIMDGLRPNIGRYQHVYVDDHELVVNMPGNFRTQEPLWFLTTSVVKAPAAPRTVLCGPGLTKVRLNLNLGLYNQLRFAKLSRFLSRPTRSIPVNSPLYECRAYQLYKITQLN